MMNRSNFKSLLFGILGGLLVVGANAVFFTSASTGSKTTPSLSPRFASVANGEISNFTAASSVATPAVVHIKSVVEGNAKREPQERSGSGFFSPFDLFEDFGTPTPSSSSGSGVIISEDGYLVTNNHVIEHADKVEVVLNDNRSFTGKVIGTDPSTDLAVVKIDQKNLPFLKFGDSDKLQIGEWVLAVGNPFNLTSTVTAGIVSAKARNINILSDKFKVESFIQTDAAVNPGNSGGALISTQGDLIGINTAIATRTGTYNGYSFAVPSNLVRKVVDDIITYGNVQRGFLGIMIQDVNGQLSKEKNLNLTRGVYVQDVNSNSAAEDAGIKKGDVITKIDNQSVNSSSELQEQVGRHRPGDQIKVNVTRDGAERTLTVTLKNKSGTTKYTTKESGDELGELGMELEELSDADKKDLDIRYGVKVSRVSGGKLRNAGIQQGFIITHIDKRPVYSPKDVKSQLRNKDGAVLIEGIGPDGKKSAHAVMF